MYQADSFDAKPMAPTCFRVLRPNVKRATPSRFGGVQLVLVGDFLQLPPVSNRGEGLSGQITPGASLGGTCPFIGRFGVVIRPLQVTWRASQGGTEG